MTHTRYSCPICGSRSAAAFVAVVLSKHEATYNQCEDCGYLYALNPHWLSEAYSSAIADTDTGLVKRNFALSAKLAAILYFNLSERGDSQCLDFAGGYGLLTRLMRDYGFNFYWHDENCTNLLATGFGADRDFQCRFVTAFEVLEHVEEPLSFIRTLMNKTGASTLVFSTLLYEDRVPDPATWWYYGFSTGQHIGFFQKRTLEFIAEKLSLRFYSSNKVHILTTKKMNRFALKISTNDIFSRLAVYLIQFRLGSRTTPDHRLMTSCSSSITDNASQSNSKQSKERVAT